MNVPLSGNTVFANIIKWRCGHTELGWALIQWLLSLKEEGNLNTETCKENRCDDGGREYSDAAITQAKENRGLLATKTH